MAFEVILTAFICSGRLSPKALPPRAITMRLDMSLIPYLSKNLGVFFSASATSVAWGFFTLARKIMAAMM